MKDQKQTLSVRQPQQKTPSEAFLDALSKWVTVFNHVYRQPMTEATIWAYLQTLKDLSVEQLERGCLEAMKQTKFTPTPAEIREYSHLKHEQAPLNATVEEPPLSMEELRALVIEARGKSQ